MMNGKLKVRRQDEMCKNAIEQIFISDQKEIVQVRTYFNQYTPPFSVRTLYGRSLTLHMMHIFPISQNNIKYSKLITFFIIFLYIWSHFLKKSLQKSFVQCVSQKFGTNFQENPQKMTHNIIGIKSITEKNKYNAI